MKARQKNLVSKLALLAVAFVVPAKAYADVRSKAAREAAEFVIERFGKDVAKEGAESLARKIESLAVKHGDEAIEAVRKLGPRTFRLVEEAGINGTKVVKLMARFGDDSVVWVIKRPKGMAIFIKYGEPGAEALVKHKEIAEPVIDALGEPAIRALQKVNVQNGRRIAMMTEEGFAQIGRTPELLEVVGKYGDKAMDFVWRNKVPLAVTVALIAFLEDPQPFIDGTRDITKIVAENTVKPAIESAGKTIEESAKRSDWPMHIALVLAVVLAALVVGRFWIGRWRA